MPQDVTPETFNFIAYWEPKDRPWGVTPPSFPTGCRNSWPRTTSLTKGWPCFKQNYFCLEQGRPWRHPFRGAPRFRRRTKLTCSGVHNPLNLDLMLHACLWKSVIADQESQKWLVRCIFIFRPFLMPGGVLAGDHDSCTERASQISGPFAENAQFCPFQALK